MIPQVLSVLVWFVIISFLLACNRYRPEFSCWSKTCYSIYKLFCNDFKMEVKRCFLFFCMGFSAWQHLAGHWCDFTLLRSLSFLPVCILLYRFCLTPVLVFSSLWSFGASTYPCKLSVRRRFCDYITFSRGTTTQPFEMLGFSRALAAFISQELVLTVWDTYWSWRPLKENALKKTGGPRKQVQFPTAWESTFYWCHWLIFFSSAKTRRVWCHCFP